MHYATPFVNNSKSIVQKTASKITSVYKKNPFNFEQAEGLGG